MRQENQASQSYLLLDFVQRLERRREGRRAVHIHLSQLSPQNRREHHVRLAINTFEDCIAAGNPAMESFPRQCRTADGMHFVEDVDPPLGLPDRGTNLGTECVTEGGNWLTEHHECEYVSREWCDEKGGEFQECESACRHNPEAEFCTLQCVIVCAL